MVGIGVVGLLAGCAAIANLKDPAALDDDDNGAIEKTDAAVLPGSGEEEDPPLRIVDAGNGDAYVELQGDGAVTREPPKDAAGAVCVVDGGLRNGDTCSQPSQCCSGACDENRQCDSTCQALDRKCDPNKTGECCLRTYCSPVLRTAFPFETWCTRCREKGTSAETAKNIFNQTVILAHSCCSGVQTGGTCE